MMLGRWDKKGLNPDTTGIIYEGDWFIFGNGIWDKTTIENSEAELTVKVNGKLGVITFSLTVKELKELKIGLENVISYFEDSA